MPAYNRVEIQGNLPGGEVWSCGLNYGGAFLVGTVGELQTWATAVASFFNALVGNALVNILSSQANVSQIRCELRNEDDTLDQAAEAQLLTVRNGQGNPAKIHQASFCISLLTAFPGRSFRGRIYWPAYAYTAVVTTQRFGSGDVLAWLNGFKEINNGIVAAAPGTADLDLIVRSRLRDLNTPVEQVAGGDVPDVQRRRRDSLIEVYQQVPI